MANVLTFCSAHTPTASLHRDVLRRPGPTRARRIAALDVRFGRSRVWYWSCVAWSALFPIRPSWWTDYRARRPPIVERGTWQVSGPGRITVSVSGTDQRNNDKPTVVVFERRADALVAVEYERSLFGSNGLQLVADPVAARQKSYCSLVATLRRARVGRGQRGQCRRLDVT